MEDRKQLKAGRIASLIFLLLAVMIAGSISIGCQNQASSIQKDLDDNPKLKQNGLTVEVTEFKNGYVKLTAKGLAPWAVKLVKDTGRVDMASYHAPLAALEEVEEMLKKRPEVKGVMWNVQ